VQILPNLVGNALKFTPKGKVAVEVPVEAAGQIDTALHFCVAHTGAGIPLEKQDLIFEALTQADTSPARKFGGTGLGLGISRRLVKMMGGRIWMASEPGRGSRFHLEQMFNIMVVLVLAATSAAGQNKPSGVLPPVPPVAQAQTASFGTLTPNLSGTPVGVTLLYSLPIPAAFASLAYQVNATGSCMFTPAASAAGGKTMADSDIGIGILATNPAAGVTIAPGLNYDPGAVRGSQGQPMYAGVAGGQATIFDLRAGREILRGDKAPSGNQLSISVRVATVPQFVTPGGLSCQVVLSVTRGT
jgi:hypothetical protein